jgi:hypothetical protein
MGDVENMNYFMSLKAALKNQKLAEVFPFGVSVGFDYRVIQL